MEYILQDASSSLQPNMNHACFTQRLRLDDIRSAVRSVDNLHHPLSRLVSLENTNGAFGGLPLTMEYTQSVRELCDEFGLLLHIDGARIFNAAAALNCDVKELVAPADSVQICLSKGLCAPVGSLLVVGNCLKPKT